MPRPIRFDDAFTQAPGQGGIGPSNIDLNSRPIVRNGESYSTVRSMSFQDEDGTETLIPTVADDGSRILSDEEAIQQYRHTGKHLGKFKSPEEATQYAQQLHREQASQYDARAGRQPGEMLNRDTAREVAGPATPRLMPGRLPQQVAGPPPVSPSVRPFQAQGEPNQPRAIPAQAKQPPRPPTQQHRPITFDDALAERQANTETYVDTKGLQFAQELGDKFPNEFPGEVPIEPFMRTRTPEIKPATKSNFGAAVKAQIPEDMQTKRRVIARSLFPDDPNGVSRVGLVDGVPVYVDDDGQLKRVSPKLVNFGAQQVANTPEYAASVAGSFATGNPLTGAALGAAGGRAAKRAVSELVFDEPATAGSVAQEMGTEAGVNLVTGGVGKAITKFADRGAIVDFTPANVKTAEAARDYIKRSTGIDVDLAQASGNRKLIAIRAFAARYPGKSAEMIQAADEVANGQLEEGVQRVMGLVAKATPAEVAGTNGINAAQMAIKVAREKVYGDLKPLYEAAYKEVPEITNPRFKALLKLPYFSDAFEKAKKLAQLEGLKYKPDQPPDLRLMDYTKRMLDDKIEELQTYAGDRQVVASLVRRRAEFVGFLDNVSNKKYQLARQRATKLYEENVDPLENGAVGVLAKIRNPKSATAAARIFTDPNITAQEIRATRYSISQQDPEAWNGLARQWIASRWNRAVRETQTGEAVNPAGKLRQSLIGTPEDKKKMAVMLPQGATQAFDDLMLAAESLARTPTAGSNTMRDTEIKDQLKGSAAVAFRWLTTPRAAIRDAAEQRVLERGVESITEALLNPLKQRQLRQVVNMTPSNKKRILLGNILAGQVAKAAAGTSDEALPDAYGAEK